MVISMTEIFKTVLFLGIIGAGATALMLIISPVTVKYFPARWQYFICFAVAVCMLVPFWRFVPQRTAQRLAPQIRRTETGSAQEHYSRVPRSPAVPAGDVQLPQRSEIMPAPQPEPKTETHDTKADIYSIAAYIWICGFAVFAASAGVSYAVFLCRKRKGSICVEKSPLFEEIKKELNIKRNIRVRVSCDTDAPMLVGIFMPVIYIPAAGMDEAEEKMVFMHELTHYRRRDLLYKWFMLFVNAVHWFNPFAYFLSANANRACEVACDMAVVKNMDEADKRLYMETILNMVKNGERR